MKRKYLKYEFWKGDNCYFSKPSLWEIIIEKLRIYKPSLSRSLLVFIPDEFETEVRNKILKEVNEG